jgi:DHA1 family tetracycline resistance protein-like MFS transporter
MSSLSARQAQRRFLLMLALRWFPVGLMIPVSVLLPLERGLTLAQLGSVAAVQGFTVMILELPTGGLSDALGRRPVLLLSSGINLLAAGLLTVAHSVPAFAGYFLLQGIYRALDSGPLEAWYVDHALAHDARADIESGLSRSGVVLGVAVAGGALTGGGLVALGPVGRFSALTVPVLAGLLVQVAALLAVLLLMAEDRPGRGAAALAAGVRGVPAAITGAVKLVGASRVVAALLLIELLWGFGMTTFETLTPVRLTEVVGSADHASALMGPVGSAAWGASAAGAALIPLLSGRIGAPWTGFVLRVAQGLTVAGMALLAGPVGVIAAYLLCYAVHGAANPVHAGLLHRQVDGPNRASLLSLNSMLGQPGFALGAIVLTAIADRATTSVAMLTGAAVLAAAAPLYLVRPRGSSTVEFRDQVDRGTSSARALTPGGTPCSP